MKDIAKTGSILFVIAAVCTGLVSFASEITKEPIARQKAQAKAAAMQEVLPSAQAFEEKEASDDIVEVQIGLQDGNPVGYALRVDPKGYDGTIEIMVGVTNEGIVEGIKILSHSETPGLGANSADSKFTDRFKGKNTLLKVTKSSQAGEDEISAITGATITSQAVTDGVNKAIEYVQNQEGGAK